MATNDTGCIYTTAGETITADAACYISAGLGGLTAGRAYLASTADQYSSIQADLVGIATAGALAAAPVRLRVIGIQDGFTGLTAGQTQYVSTAGGITATLPALNARALGVAISATEIQLTSASGGTDLAAVAAPTLSGNATAYVSTAQTITLSNWSAYNSPTIWCQVVDSGGSVVTAASAVTDNEDGTILVPMPAGVGTYTIQVRCQQFGGAASKTTEHEIVLTSVPAFRYYRLTGFIADNIYSSDPSVSYFRLFTGVGPGQGTVQAFPYPTGGGVNGTQYPASYMTAAALPSPYVVTASFEYSATYAGWKGLDNLSTHWWALGHNPAQGLLDWIQIDLGAAYAIRSAWVRYYNAYNEPGVTLQGSNDALAWTTVSVATNTTYTGTWIM